MLPDDITNESFDETKKTQNQDDHDNEIVDDDQPTIEKNRSTIHPEPASIQSIPLLHIAQDDEKELKPVYTPPLKEEVQQFIDHLRLELFLDSTSALSSIRQTKL